MLCTCTPGTCDGQPAHLCRAKRLPPVTMAMGERDAALLAEIAFPAAVMDQLWLRTVLIAQRRHIPHGERPAYDARADRLLAVIRDQARTTR